MPLPNDARKFRGTIERSISVDFQQHHHELGRSVTTADRNLQAERRRSARPSHTFDGTTWSIERRAQGSTSCAEQPAFE
jgi:hypothetical protein